jgi:hypothetical protein
MKPITVTIEPGADFNCFAFSNQGAPCLVCGATEHIVWTTPEYYLWEDVFTLYECLRCGAAEESDIESEAELV